MYIPEKSGLLFRSGGFSLVLPVRDRHPDRKKLNEDITLSCQYKSP